jgi:hypothetical protein
MAQNIEKQPVNNSFPRLNSIFLKYLLILVYQQ